MADNQGGDSGQSVNLGDFGKQALKRTGIAVGELDGNAVIVRQLSTDS
jgi:hypothetical protein